MDTTTFIRVFLLIFFILLLLGMRRKNKAVEEKIKYLKKTRSGIKCYFCYNAEDLGKGLVQLYGQPHGTPITPGMILTGPDSKKFKIEEVYAGDKTPDKPDSAITEEDPNTAIVIKTNDWNWKKFNEDKKRDTVIAFTVN